MRRRPPSRHSVMHASDAISHVRLSRFRSLDFLLPFQLRHKSISIHSVDSPFCPIHGRLHPSADHRIGLQDRMQKDAYEMGQIVLELLHGWSLVGFWVRRISTSLAPYSQSILQSNAPISLYLTAVLTIATAAQYCWPRIQHLGTKKMHRVLFERSRPYSFLLGSS